MTAPTPPHPGEPSTWPSHPRWRPASRGVVTDPAGAILLVHFDFTGPDVPHGFWACPGGGIDPGETLAAGLRRELAEEIGLDVHHAGSPVWWKTHRWPDHPSFDGQLDTYYWVPVPARFEPRGSFTPEQMAAEHVDAMRWWSLDDVREAQAAYDAGDLTIVFSPHGLGHLLSRLLSDGRPCTPLRLDPL